MAVVIHEFEVVERPEPQPPASAVGREARHRGNRIAPREVERLVRRAAERLLRVRAY
jgi:hypothetical protein